MTKRQGCPCRSGTFAAEAAAEDAARGIVDRPELNLGSPKQLQEVLFDQLGMPKTKKTKTGYSTAAKELENLAKTNDHPFLERLMAFRESQKMKSTVEGLVKAVGEDGRIHTTFNQTVAATGVKMNKTPQVGEVWRNRDNEICYIVKVYENASVLSNEIRPTYRIIEYTGESNANVMECEQCDLIEYLGLGLNPFEKLFEVEKE